jgi:hypothetical protein
MILFENILSDEEAERLIELGDKVGYERSSDVGERQADGTYTNNINNGRTSTNAWCVDGCYEDPTAKMIMQRIGNITGIPETNSENLQLLRYAEDQFYQRHNDYISHQVREPYYFIYFSCCVKRLLLKSQVVDAALDRSSVWSPCSYFLHVLERC